MAYVNELINAEISRKYCEIVIDNGLEEYPVTDLFMVPAELLEKLTDLELEIEALEYNDTALAALADAREFAEAINLVIG